MLRELATQRFGGTARKIRAEWMFGIWQIEGLNSVSCVVGRDSFLFQAGQINLKSCTSGRVLQRGGYSTQLHAEESSFEIYIQKSSEALRSIQALLLIRMRARKRPRTLRSFQDENTSLPISSIGQSSGLISSTVQNLFILHQLQQSNS